MFAWIKKIIGGVRSRRTPAIRPTSPWPRIDRPCPFPPIKLPPAMSLTTLRDLVCEEHLPEDRRLPEEFVLTVSRVEAVSLPGGERTLNLALTALRGRGYEVTSHYSMYNLDLNFVCIRPRRPGNA